MRVPRGGAQAGEPECRSQVLSLPTSVGAWLPPRPCPQPGAPREERFSEHRVMVPSTAQMFCSTTVKHTPPALTIFSLVAASPGTGSLGVFRGSSQEASLLGKDRFWGPVLSSCCTSTAPWCASDARARWGCFPSLPGLRWAVLWAREAAQAKGSASALRPGAFRGLHLAASSLTHTFRASPGGGAALGERLGGFRT